MMCYEIILHDNVISLFSLIKIIEFLLHVSTSFYLFISRSKRDGENDERASKNNVLNIT